jgi:hypothetical protein
VVVEAVQQVRPLLFAFFDVIELFFELGGVRHVEDVREALHQQVADHHADLGGIEASA